MFKGFFNTKNKSKETTNHTNELMGESGASVDELEDKENNKSDFFNRLRSGLGKTRKGIVDKVDSVFRLYPKVDEELFEELEELLIMGDVGINTSMEIIDKLRNHVKEEKISETDRIRLLLKEEIRLSMLQSNKDNNLNIDPPPTVILVVGVNGAGKTTTIGKLAYNLRNEGKQVVIAAGDTFRAAAIEQLEEWSKKSGARFISHKEGSDPAAVVYDGIQAAKAKEYDVLICDTAGRLHNKKNLMNELNKIFRIVEREYPEANKEVLLVLDASTGQNAIIQARVFGEVCDITGIVLTKLDGTAKGGIVIALQSELGIPIKLVGIGEKIEDLQPFNVDEFIEALFN